MHQVLFSFAADWLGHARMFEYFGGVSRLVVPDNLKAAVTKADRFSPTLNESYRAMCRYYDIVPLPARAYGERAMDFNSMRRRPNRDTRLVLKAWLAST